ncbi:MAG TPA: Ig-like domain repeat protein, partial [Gemmatimonadales bacterium]|nr:Ig-like domain repeat protein [Gemmatimonadales bacterium]
MSTTRTACRLLPAVALLLSCGGGDLVLPSGNEPAAVTILEGDAQSGRVGAALADPVVARVTDAQGRPVTSVPVAFVFMGGIDATVAPDTATTDADGRASFQVVLGTEVGQGNAEVRVSTAAGGRTLAAPLGFSAVSTDANELVAISGDGQSAPVGGALPDPLVVQVTDGFGNPIAGVDVGWAAAEGGSVSEATVPTGPDGFASVQVTLGPNAGIQHTTASAPGLAGSPVTFAHTALPGAPTTLERISGDGQSAVVGTSVPDPLVVRARDAAGNPVAGLGVTWVVTTGGGSVLPQNGTTGPEGLASTRWTLGQSPGGNTVTAVISGVGTVGFTATGNAGAPPGLSVETQPPTTAIRGVAFGRAPVVQLREPDGSVRALADVPVSVDLATAGGTLRGTLTRNTGPDGRAEFRELMLEGPPGSYTLGFAAPGYAGTTSSAIALARAPTTIEITADGPDPSVAGAAVRVAFRVRSAGGTPAGTVRVSADDGTSCSATTTDGACTLALTGVGSRTITAAYSGATEFEGSSDTESHEVRAPPPPVLALVVQPPSSATIGAAFGVDPVVQLRDAGGNDLPAAGVTVSVELASGDGSLAGTAASTTGADGRAAFPGLSIGGATGRHTLRFRAEGYTPVTSNPI